MRAVAVLAAAVLFPASAAAYSEPGAFARDPSADTSGGGGGLYFTGSPRQHGLECGACHADGPSGTALRLSALIGTEPSALFDGVYLPGATYEIEVAFDGDRLVPPAGCEDHEDEPCDVNLFALEILGSDGQPAGVFCPSPFSVSSEGDGCGACQPAGGAATRVEAGCSVVLANAFDEATFTWRNGVTAYSFFWMAPAADTGPLTAYVSAVDGAGRTGEDGEVTSHTGDGVVTLAVPAGAREGATKGGGCSATGALDGRTGPGLVVLLFALIALRRRADRRRSPEITQRNPVCESPVSGLVAERALGR